MLEMRRTRAEDAPREALETGTSLARQHRRAKKSDQSQFTSNVTFPGVVSLPPTVQAAVYRTIQQHPPCLLCGDTCVYLGLFVPNESQRWGFPVGYWAGRIYTLCQTCQPRKHAAAHNRRIAQRVEQILWQERQQQRMARWN